MTVKSMEASGNEQKRKEKPGPPVGFWFFVFIAAVVVFQLGQLFTVFRDSKNFGTPFAYK